MTEIKTLRNQLNLNKSKETWCGSEYVWWITKAFSCLKVGKNNNILWFGNRSLYFQKSAVSFGTCYFRCLPWDILEGKLRLPEFLDVNLPNAYPEFFKFTKHIELVKLKYLLLLEKLYGVKTGWSFVKKNYICSQTISHSLFNAFKSF